MRLIRYTQPAYRSLDTLPGSYVRSPWSGLESEINRLFETTLGGYVAAPAGQFPVDLYEDKDHNYVRAELPGVNRDDINVEVVDGYLTITAARKTPATPAADAAEAQPERSVSFSRSVSLTDEVQSDKISAAYENGVLTVTLPKREEAKPRKITVAVK